MNCWSGPRSLSTSLMYAFHNRGDVECHDEPLYAHYLVKTAADRPYRDLVLSSQSHDGAEVVRGLLEDETVVGAAPASKTVAGRQSRDEGQTQTRQPRFKFKYVKHMAKHAVELGAAKWAKRVEGAIVNGGGGPCHHHHEPPPARAYDALLQGSKNFILVRDPAAVARSFSEVLPPTLEETCLPALCQLFSDLRRMARGCGVGSNAYLLEFISFSRVPCTTPSFASTYINPTA